MAAVATKQRHPNAVEFPSQVFAATDPQMETTREKLLNAHWQGKRIREYPDAERDLIMKVATWESTDEGRAELAEAARVAGRFVAEPGHVPATVIPRGAFIPKYGGNAVLEYGAQRKLGHNPVDPLTAMRMKWEEKNPGKTAHWSSKDILGLASASEIMGGSDREIVYGDKGQRIEWKDLVLTCEPTEQVQQRRDMEAAASVQALRGQHPRYTREIQTVAGEELPTKTQAMNFGLRDKTPGE